MNYESTNFLLYNFLLKSTKYGVLAMTDLVVKRISFRGRKVQGEGMKLDKNRFETYFHLSEK